MKLIATVDKIISVTQHNDDDVEFTVMCMDGVQRVFHDSGFTNIRAGYQFEYESEIPPHLCNPDYKTVYETIDKALQDSTDNILGKVLSALQGRINPLEARRIIIDRLLLK